MPDDIKALWPDPPTTPVESLAHTLDAFHEADDDRQVIIATSGIYPVRTGLTFGDLRAIRRLLDERS